MLVSMIPGGRVPAACRGPSEQGLLCVDNDLHGGYSQITHAPLVEQPYISQTNGLFWMRVLTMSIRLGPRCQI